MCRLVKAFAECPLVTLPYFAGVATHHELVNVDSFRAAHVTKVIFYDMPATYSVMNALHGIHVRELIMFAQLIPSAYQFAPAPEAQQLVPPSTPASAPRNEQSSAPPAYSSVVRSHPGPTLSATMPFPRIRVMMYRVDMMSDDDDVTDDV